MRRSSEKPDRGELDAGLTKRVVKEAKGNLVGLWRRSPVARESRLVLAFVLGTALLFAAITTPAVSATMMDPRGFQDLSLKDFLQRVLEHNETLQIRFLESAVKHRQYRAELGAFEPEVTGSLDRVETDRENTIEQARNQLSNIFLERNNIYNAGLESLVPSGARVRIGWTLRDLSNNLTRNIFGGTSTNFSQEYSMFAGISVVQPLLKNGWPAYTLANIRSAALSSDIAFQEYRRQLILTLATAEARYWNLFLAQEQFHFFQDSVNVAEKLLEDSQARHQAGKASELDVMEAEAGVALRKTKLNEADQKLWEAIIDIISLFSETVETTSFGVRASAPPEPRQLVLSYLSFSDKAFKVNPDYLIQRKRVSLEEVRVNQARNQRLPQLDFKASYGASGLGGSASAAWDDVNRIDFPAWSVGVEMRIPLLGGVKGRNELQAARLRREQASLGLKEVEIQIANAIDNAMRKVRVTYESVGNYQKVVTLRQNVLETEFARLVVGKSDSRKVLEAEEDLFEAKISALEALVQHQRSHVELDVVCGLFLEARDMEITQYDLRQKTSRITRSGRFSEDQYRRYMQGIAHED